MSDDDVQVTKKRPKAAIVDDDESTPSLNAKPTLDSKGDPIATASANEHDLKKPDGEAAKRKRKVIEDDSDEGGAKLPTMATASAPTKPTVTRAGGVSDEDDAPVVKKKQPAKRKQPPQRSSVSDESDFDADNASDEPEEDEEEASDSSSSSSGSDSDSASDSDDSDSDSRKRTSKSKKVVKKKAPARAPASRRAPARRGGSRNDEEDWENMKAAATSRRTATRGKVQAVATATAKAATRNDPSMRRIGLGLRNRKEVAYQKIASGAELPDQEEEPEEEAPRKKKTAPKKPSPKKRTAMSSDSESDGESKEEDSSGDEEDDQEGSGSGSGAEEEEQNIDELEQPDTEPEDKTIEKLLGVRDTPTGQEVLVKWKNTSYMHLDWVPSKSLEADKHTKQKLIKFLKNPPPVDGEDAFDQCFLEVDRIIAHEKRHGVMKYLVKWNGLPYAEATWELPEDIKEDTKVQQFERWNSMPDASELKVPPRPPASAWRKQEASPVYKNENTLRPYQLEGLNWLSFCWFNRRNSILADEMGLGKTVQSVSILEYLQRVQKIRGPFLVIAPLSTIPHWKREFENWTDMNAIVYHGNAESRAILRTYEFYFRDQNGSYASKSVPKFNALITTYEVVMQDRAALSKINWRYLVVDEAHRLKNKNSRLLNELKLYKFDHLLLLTGTPLQNNTEELWTLLNFLEESEFSSLEDFLEEFGDLKEHSQVEKLQSVLGPFMLRRMKDDVEKSIAPKEETIVEVELTAIQREYYKAIYDKNLGILVKGTKGGNTGSMMNIMLQLRKCCNHPFLLKGVEQSVTDSLPDKSPKTVYDALVKASGKMVLIDKLLPKLKSQGHKVLIFSQWVRILDILEDYMHHKGYLYERIDGGVRGNDRQASIDRFSKPDSDRFVFLLCTRAGGLGINLTAADTVIIFDSDWNPQNDLQAQARCHRIGQKQLVKVYRLITRGTYEAQMFERSSKKLGLDQAVLHTMKKSQNAEDDKPQLSKKEIDALLKYGAYDIFREGNDNAGTAYDERDIDQILERNSRTVVHTATEREEKGVLSTFAKATFTPAAPTVDPTDPDFWAKLFPNRPLVDPNITFEPRARRKTERYGTAQERGDLASDDDEAGAADMDFEEEPDAAADAEMGKDQPGRRRSGWLNAERMRFKIALVRLGYGRWRAIKHAARLNRWSVAQIRLYADVWVRKMAKILEMDEETAFGTIRNATPEEEREDERRDREEHPPAAPIIPPLPPPLTAAPAAAPAAGAEGTDAAHAPPAAHTDGPVGGITDFSNDPSMTDAKFEEYLSRNAKQIHRRLQTLAQLGEFVRPHKTPAELPLTDEMIAGATDAPAPWWTLADDKAILFGCATHGFLEWDAIAKDKALGFADRVRLDTDKDEASAAKLPWPSSGALGTRLRRLLKALHALRRNEERQRRKREKESKDEEKKKRRVGLEQEWSKREKFDFFRALTTFGVPLTDNGEYDWEFIRTKANLKRKSAELIEKYYIEFLKICREIISSPPSEAKVKGTDAKNVKKEKVIQNDRLPEITYSQCRRMVMRITLFSSIRTKVLPHPDLRQIVNRASIGAALPTWWRHEHDAALLQGVSKYGFGNWEEMCGDASLPFLEVAKRLQALRPPVKPELPLAPVPAAESAPTAAPAAPVSSAPASGAEAKPAEAAEANDDEDGDGDKPAGEKEAGKPETAEAKAKKEKEKENMLITVLKFPKDKIISKRLDTLVTLFTKPQAVPSHSSAASSSSAVSSKSAKQTSIFSFSQKGVKPTDEPEGADGGEPKAKREKLDPAAKKEKAERRKQGEKPLKPKKFTTDVPRNPDGSIRFPITLGAMNVHSLGTVVWDRPNWQTDKYIYPAGFKTSRAYASLTQPEGRCLYYSEIVDDGKDPKFVVTAETGQTFSAPSATSAWVQVLKAVADVKKEKRETISISGPEYFGFANPTIHKLVQELPNANKCTRYRMVDYAAKAAEAEAAEKRQREERDRAKSQDITAMMGNAPLMRKELKPAPAPAPAANGGSLLNKDDSNGAKKRKSEEGDAQPPRPKPPPSGPAHAPPTASKSGAPVVQTKLSFTPTPTSKADLRHILGEDTPN